MFISQLCGLRCERVTCQLRDEAEDIVDHHTCNSTYYNRIAEFGQTVVSLGFLLEQKSMPTAVDVLQHVCDGRVASFCTSLCLHMQ
jgi:hypothetical protein